MENLQGKFAVVTGGGSGIGRSIVLALAEAGAHIFVSDIQAGPAEAVAAEARERGVQSHAFVCDVARRDEVEALADAAYAAFGRVDILCNNAGISWRPYRNIFDATLEDFDFMFGVNFYGVLHGLKAFLPRMRQQAGRKHIVNTASLSSMVPMEGHTAYSATKAAVAGLSEAMAGELAEHGFGVTILCPGPIPTNLGANTSRLRSADERVFESVATPMIERCAKFTMPSVDPVGAMVCHAILTNQLYLHTAPLPGDLVADRMHTWFGGQTLTSGV